MSKFFSDKYKRLVPYVPGERPRSEKYIKLNTNENPYPPSPLAQRLAREAAGDLNLYSDPACQSLIDMATEKLGVKPEEIIFTNSSDEILNFAFMAFCDKNTPACFADVTYGFYPVFANLNGVPYREIPLKEDFTISPEDYFNAGGTVFIVNPNANTGYCLSLSDIENIIRHNSDNIVVIDEAYVDFGGTSALPLIRKYNNLLVTRTFSKSRSMAGARLGFGLACPELIQDLNTIRFSTNPYNVNSMSMAAGIGALADEDYFRRCCDKIKASRNYTAKELQKLGYTVLDGSQGNFLLIGSPKMDGRTLNAKLKANGILGRFLDTPRLQPYLRLSIGTQEDMDACIKVFAQIWEEQQ